MDTNIKRTIILTLILFVGIIFYKEFKDVIPYLNYLPLLVFCASIAWFIDLSIQMREDRKKEAMDKALRKLAK